MTRADVIAFLTALLLAAFATGLALTGVFGLNALTFVLAILVILYFLRYFPPSPSIFTVIGLIAGIVLIVLAPALSPATLEPVALLLVLGILWLMGK